MQIMTRLICVDSILLQELEPVSRLDQLVISERVWRLGGGGKKRYRPRSRGIGGGFMDQEGKVYSFLL